MICSEDYEKQWWVCRRGFYGRTKMIRHNIDKHSPPQDQSCSLSCEVIKEANDHQNEIQNIVQSTKKTTKHRSVDNSVIKNGHDKNLIKKIQNTNNTRITSTIDDGVIKKSNTKIIEQKNKNTLFDRGLVKAEKNFRKVKANSDTKAELNETLKEFGINTMNHRTPWTSTMTKILRDGDGQLQHTFVSRRFNKDQRNIKIAPENHEPSLSVPTDECNTSNSSRKCLKVLIKRVRSTGNYVCVNTGEHLKRSTNLLGRYTP